MATYGRTFTLANPANFTVNSPATGGGKAGEFTKESGFLAYYEVLFPSYRYKYWKNLFLMIPLIGMPDAEKWRHLYLGR